MDRRKFLVGMGSLAAGAAAASGTGAFTAANVGREADVNVVNDKSAYLTLSPGGARGVQDRVGYENGDLYIDLDESASGSGVNDQAQYQLGAMDDDAQGDEIGFESLYDENTVPAAASPGTPLAADGTDQSAFVVTNHSGQTLDIKIGFQDDNQNETSPDGATVYLQGSATAVSADGDGGSSSGGPGTDPDTVEGATATNTAELDLDNPSGAQDDAEEALSFNNGNDGDEAIPAGESVYVSFQIDTEDSDTDGSINLSDNLVIAANNAADPGVD